VYSRTLAVVWITLNAAAPTASAELITLTTSKDNTLIQQTDPSSQLSNGQGDVFVGRTNQDGQGPARISIRRGLIAFDIAGGIPPGSTIHSLSLTMRDVMGLNGDPNIELHRGLKDWGEGASFQNGGMGASSQEGDASWNYRLFNSSDPTASPPWSTLGGDFSDTVSASAIIRDDHGGGQLFAWSSASQPQMLMDVQDWLHNPANNFGWLLLGDESMGQILKRLNSGEANMAPSLTPALTIEYTIPEPRSLALAVIVASCGLFAAGRCFW
jgi:hypothetical protein